MKDWTDKNTKNSRKLVPQVRCGMPEGALYDLETGVKWGLELTAARAVEDLATLGDGGYNQAVVVAQVYWFGLSLRDDGSTEAREVNFHKASNDDS